MSRLITGVFYGQAEVTTYAMGYVATEASCSESEISFLGFPPPVRSVEKGRRKVVRSRRAAFSCLSCVLGVLRSPLACLLAVDVHAGGVQAHSVIILSSTHPGH